MLVPIMMMTESLPEVLTLPNVIGFAYISVVCALVAQLLWFRGIQRLPAFNVSLLLFVSPLTAVILGFIFLQQTLSTTQIIGALTIISAIMIAQLQLKLDGHRLLRR